MSVGRADTDQEHQNERNHLWDRRARATESAAVAGIEARGFIFGAAIAARLGLGFLPVRKAGKLPGETIGIDYALEYGAARIEIDPGAIASGERDPRGSRSILAR